MLLISIAVSITEKKLNPGQVASSLRTDLAVVIANTSIGLCAAILVYRDWRTAILMAVPVAGLFLTLKAYTSERQRHDRLEFLYEAARAFSQSSEIGTALEGLLAQALEAFRAEVAEIIFFSPTAPMRSAPPSAPTAARARSRALSPASSKNSARWWRARGSAPARPVKSPPGPWPITCSRESWATACSPSSPVSAAASARS